MRIISGSKKSISIRAPKDLPSRPTTDKVKESLFNILINRFKIDEIIVLDLFAGTVNISYEFSSRGVKKIISVDNNLTLTKQAVRKILDECATTLKYYPQKYTSMYIRKQLIQLKISRIM